MRARPLIRRTAAVALVAAVGLFGLPSAQASAGSGDTGARNAAAKSAAAGTSDVRAACDTPTKPGVATCLALIRTDIKPHMQAQLAPHAAPAGVGYGPASLQNAYALPSSTAGSGQTVAVVDAYDYPNAEADLATYRSDWGLPACTSASGCFRKVNEHGQASPLPSASGATGWATEEALDLDMVSAACPNCKIVLVEADSATVEDLGSGVNAAVNLGVSFISNSYGAPEYDGQAADEAAYYDHPGVAITASTGDGGYGVEFPAASTDVVAVGGTSLKSASNTRGWTETAWDDAGSGCSATEAKPAWQGDSGCANRTNADVSAVADPNTGVAVYDSYDQGGWLEVGGTSASSPIIASVYAMAGAPATRTYPAMYPYAHSDDLNDVTSGTNGSCDPDYLCTAGDGYDGPTGLGTPNGLAAFEVPDGDLVTVSNPGTVKATQDVAFSLQLKTYDSADGQTLTYEATGLPAGLSIDTATGVITGTATATGSSVVNVTATDTTGAVGKAKFTVAVVSSVSFSGPGAQAGYIGSPVSLTIDATDAVSGRTLTYSATGLPGGVSIAPATGVVSGLPTGGGYFQPTITARDAAGRSLDESFVWYMAPAQVAAKAGPVTLGTGHACLDVSGGKTADGTPIDVASCANHAQQQWTVTPAGTIQALGKCLTVAGTSAQLATCTVSSTAQQWRVASFGELQNPAAGKCLDVHGSTSGTPVDISSCAGGSGQSWSVPAGPLVSAVTGVCADSGAGTSGAVQAWYCAAASSQTWSVRTDGTVRMGSKCLAVSGTSATTLATCTSSASQQWRITRDGTVTSQASGKCLTDPGTAAVAGTKLTVASCDNPARQEWHVE